MLAKIRRLVRSMNEPDSEHSDQFVRYEYATKTTEILLGILADPDMEMPAMEVQMELVAGLHEVRNHAQTPKDLCERIGEAIKNIESEITSLLYT